MAKDDEKELGLNGWVVSALMEEYRASGGSADGPRPSANAELLDAYKQQGKEADRLLRGGGRSGTAETEAQRLHREEMRNLLG